MNDVMIDLETMGTGPRAAIVAIGAVEFDPEAGTCGERFQLAVDLGNAVAMGGEMDASTVLWWMQQGDDARAAFSRGGVPLSQALVAFTAWLASRGVPDSLRMWGNGAGFDNVILASAYKAAGLQQPWRHWNDRCYRTVKAMHPHIKLQRIGTHHDAADDAESQARHLLDMLSPRQCRWTQDGDEGAWDTSCGQRHLLIDGGPTDNRMRWCCYCGQPLTEGPPESKGQPAAL